MPEQNNQNKPENMPKTTSEFQDFGVENSSAPKSAIPLGAATQTPSGPAASPASPAVSPVAPKTPPVSAPNPAARKKVLLGCFGAFASIILILLILSFVFLAQSGEGQNPIAKLLGVDQSIFINGLITFVHFIFILVSLVAFVFTMIGLFRASMAKKFDKEARRAALKTSVISGISLFLILIVWGFTYVYLDSKRVEVAGELLEPIVTTPEETLGLSAPIEIKFDASNVPVDRNQYSIVSHNWDFGDETTGTSQITSHVYKEKGIYTVTLSIIVKDKDTGEVGTGYEYTKQVSIENQALAALFKADPQSGEAPLEVNFDATESTDPDGNIQTYEWDFDEDGEFDDAKGSTAKHTFNKIGKYNVSLRVTSTTGEFDVEEKEIIVEEETGPEAVISIVDNPAAFTIGVNYTFKGEESTSPNGQITKYEWNFHDGSKNEITKTIGHSFKKEGTYEVSLTVTDEKDEIDEVKKIIKVESPKGSPKAKIVTDPALAKDASSVSGMAPFAVVFNAKQSTDSDNNIVDYKWDFDGDGEFDSFGELVTHTYLNEGSYNVELQVEDADKNIGKASTVVKVEAQGIVVNVEADKVDGSVPLTVNFDASGSSYSKGQITSYLWDFGDKSPVKSGAASISHKYTAIGTYNAIVTVTGSDGSKNFKTILITVREIPLSACFVSVFEKGPAPLTTAFDPGCSTGTISNYLWDFGDGSTSTGVNPEHTFKDPGTYVVTLEVSDSENTIDKAEVTITVSAAE